MEKQKDSFAYGIIKEIIPNTTRAKICYTEGKRSFKVMIYAWALVVSEDNKIQFIDPLVTTGKTLIPASLVYKDFTIK